MASYFPEAGNLNGSNADMCSNVAGSSSSRSGYLFELSDRSNETIILLFLPLLALLAAILDLSMTTTPILPLGRATTSCIRSVECRNNSDQSQRTQSNPLFNQNSHELHVAGTEYGKIFTSKSELVLILLLIS